MIESTKKITRVKDIFGILRLKRDVKTMVKEAKEELEFVK